MSLSGLYPGSFDPLTNGHLDIIRRALGIFDHLIVGIARDSRKKPLFTVEERQEMIQEALSAEPRAEVNVFEGLTVQYASACGASAIIRGLRAVADFEYELQMANMNRRLNPDVETLFMMTSENYFFVSSQNVKEVAALGGDISNVVPPSIAEKVISKLSCLGQLRPTS